MARELFKNIDEIPVSLNKTDLSAVLNISKTQAYYLMRSKGFPTLRIGKRMIVPKEALLKWIEENIGNNLEKIR